MSAAREYRERLAQVAERLPDDKLAELLDFADFLSERKAQPASAHRRQLGYYEGQIRIAPSFFDPLPDDILDAFEGRGK